MSIPDFTIIVGLDREHLAEFAVSFPTWAKNKPDLMKRPMIFVCDGDDTSMGGTRGWWSAIGEIIDPHRETDELQCLFTRGDFSRQREKMLTGLATIGPLYTTTPYYLKCDTDLIATPTALPDWIDPAWFDGDPAIIAPRWHYTKPASMVPQFDAWADQYPQHFGALRISHRVVGNVAKHSRMISYCMFGNTAWTRQMAELAGDRLPIPSQDTYLSCCAVRNGAKIVHAPMNELGWRHVGGGGKRLEIAAREAMR